MEDALYEIASMRLFARLSRDSALAGSHHHHEFPPPARAASTARQLFKTINRWLAEAGVSDDPRHFGGCHHH
ncbi:hypothetical protein [Klebsiella pneumoniae]|uniref:hypothetical protein n=1 Tax=Klebsiella pneumoniae TaxID=573 RepID=UPI003B3BCD03